MVAENTDTEIARDYIAQARAAQAESGARVYSPLKVGGAKDYAAALAEIDDAVAHVKIPYNHDDLIKPYHLSRMVLRLEEICKRNHLPIRPELRAECARIFLDELIENHNALDVKIDKILAITAHHGAIASILKNEFPDFTNIAATLEKYSLAPREALQTMRKAIAALTEQEEFASLQGPEDRKLLEQAVAKGGHAAEYLRKNMAAHERKKALDETIATRRAEESEHPRARKTVAGKTGEKWGR